jgi:hypothetical protein
MPTTRPTLAPEPATALGVRGRLESDHLLFFDDNAAVMYRKIDTTPLSATSPRRPTGLRNAGGFRPDRRGSFADIEIGCVVSSFIFSRMTLRPVFAPAGAFPERMTP